MKTKFKKEKLGKWQFIIVQSNTITLDIYEMFWLHALKNKIISYLVDESKRKKPIKIGYGADGTQTLKLIVKTEIMPPCNIHNGYTYTSLRLSKNNNYVRFNPLDGCKLMMRIDEALRKYSRRKSYFNIEDW